MQEVATIQFCNSRGTDRQEMKRRKTKIYEINKGVRELKRKMNLLE